MIEELKTPYLMGDYVVLEDMDGSPFTLDLSEVLAVLSFDYGAVSRIEWKTPGIEPTIVSCQPGKIIKMMALRKRVITLDEQLKREYKHKQAEAFMRRAHGLPDRDEGGK